MAKKILVVEDDKILSKMYSTKLKNAGMEVAVAGNGEEGLELMKSFGPDLVLMDLMMPKMDGFTALEKAKADPKLKSIPIVILSNLSTGADADEVLKKGAKDFIVKSNLTPGQVVERVKKLLS